MIFDYKTVTIDGSQASVELSGSPEYCCDAAKKAHLDGFIVLGLNSKLFLLRRDGEDNAAAIYNVRYCPFCGEGMLSREVGQRRLRSVVKTELVERQTVVYEDLPS